ncbi:hypothetical protein SNEBB_004686, partial [Seison nebaliae]
MMEDSLAQQKIYEEERKKECDIIMRIYEQEEDELKTKENLQIVSLEEQIEKLKGVCERKIAILTDVQSQNRHDAEQLIDLEKECGNLMKAEKDYEDAEKENIELEKENSFSKTVHTSETIDSSIEKSLSFDSDVKAPSQNLFFDDSEEISIELDGNLEVNNSMEIEKSFYVQLQDQTNIDTQTISDIEENFQGRGNNHFAELYDERERREQNFERLKAEKNKKIQELDEEIKVLKVSNVRSDLNINDLDSFKILQERHEKFEEAFDAIKDNSSELAQMKKFPTNGLFLVEAKNKYSDIFIEHINKIIQGNIDIYQLEIYK